jgi:hypothetical protein
VDDDGVHPHVLHQHDVFCGAAAQLGIGHGRATVLDDHGLALKVSDIGQGLDEDGGFLDGLLHVTCSAGGASAARIWG